MKQKLAFCFECLRYFSFKYIPCDLYVYLALFLEKISQVNLARDLLNWVLNKRLTEPNFFFWNNLGVYALLFYRQTGDDSFLLAAERAFICAATIDPENDLFKKNFKIYQAVLGDYYDLNDELTKVIFIPDKDTHVHLSLAVVLVKLKNYPDANEHFVEASKVSTDFVQSILAKTAYSWFLPLVNQRQDSLEIQNEILEAIYNRYNRFESAQVLLEQIEQQLMELWPERFPQGLGEGLLARLQRKYEGTEESELQAEFELEQEQAEVEPDQGFWTVKLKIKARSLFEQVIAYNERLWQSKDEHVQQYLRLLGTFVLFCIFVVIVVVAIWLVVSLIIYLNNHPFYWQLK
ncbi:MAG: hypothetical protein GF365_04990 [Candidatus Buchananbacteria bacterium]|nr:hypothetical protein [Candidatus Buchananbacteria bacterium]